MILLPLNPFAVVEKKNLTSGGLIFLFFFIFWRQRGAKKTAELRKEVARGGQGPRGVRGGGWGPFAPCRMDLAP